MDMNHKMKLRRESASEEGRTCPDPTLRTCTECKGVAEGQRENYNYTECGLKNVVLKEVLVCRCPRCGAEQVEIPNMDGLHRTIALAVLCKRRLLSGDEIRFLRNVAGMTATGLAKSLGVTKTAVSRWENRAKIGLASDRAIRATCGLGIIADIVNQQTGVVAPEDVRRTMDAIQRFFAQFSSRNMAAGLVQEAEATDSEKLMIDPRMPFNFSLLAQAPTASTLVQ